MADTVGSIQYVVDVDTKGLDAGLKSAEDKATGSSDKIGQSAEQGGSRVSNALKTVGKAAVGIVGAGVGGMVSLVKTSVKSYAEYEQMVGGVETLFGNSSSQVMQYAQNAYKTAGISANQYMEQATSFSASLLQGLGGDTAKAAEYANLAIVDMGDNANKMGTSIESIQWAYQGFAKQNYTMLDNLKLGYGGTASEMARLINDTGVMGAGFHATAKNMNEVPFDKVIEGIHKVQEKIGMTGTTAKEAATTISGSLGMAKAAWGNLVTGLADGSQNTDQLITNMIDSVKTVAVNLLPAVKTALVGTAGLIKELAPIIIKELPSAMSMLLPPLLGAVVDLIVALTNAFPGMISVLFDALVKILPTLINALVTIVPKLIVAMNKLFIIIVKKLTEPSTLTMLLNGAIQMLMAIVEALPIIITALTEAMPMVIDSIIRWATEPKTIKLIMKAAVKLFMGFVKAVPRMLGALISAYKTLFGSLWAAIVNIVGGIGGEIVGVVVRVLSPVFNVIAGVVGQIAGFIGGVLSTVFNVVASVVGAIIGFIGGILGVVFNVMSVVFGVVLRIIGVVVLLGMAIVGVAMFIIGFILGIIGGILGFIGGILGAIFNVVFDVVSAIVNFIVGVIGTIFSILGAIIGFIGGILGAIFNVIAGVVGGIIGFIGGAIGAIFAILGAIGGWIFNNVIVPVGQFFAGLWNGVVNGVRGMWNTFCGIIGAIAGWVFNNVIRPIGDFFVGLWNGILSGITGLRNGISQAFGVIVGIVKAPINTIIGGVNKVIGKLNSLRIPKWVPGIGGMSLNFPYIPRLYTGGIVEPSGAIIRAGDGGESEWVVPESKMASLVEKLEARRGDGGDNITININGTFATSASEQRKVAEQIFEQLEIIKRKRLEGSL